MKDYPFHILLVIALMLSFRLLAQGRQTSLGPPEEFIRPDGQRDQRDHILQFDKFTGVAPHGERKHLENLVVDRRRRINERRGKPSTSGGQATAGIQHLTSQSSDSVEVFWLANYNGPHNADNASDLAVDSFGNVYVTGTSFGADTTTVDYATVKYNTSGVEQWVTRYDGPANSNDQATAVAVDGSGNVYVTGNSFGSILYSDYATVKYDASGVEQWVAQYNGPANSNDQATALAVDPSGNVYVTGNSLGSNSNIDYATVKYDAWGVEQWVERYNGPGNNHDFASALAVDSSGNVYVTGTSFGADTTTVDYATVKYNTSGVEQWVARYDGPANSNDAATALAVDGSGNVYVTGYSLGSNPNFDYATVKYNASGVEQWVAQYNGPENSDDRASALAVDGPGNVYVTGYSFGSDLHSDYATVKYDASGVEQWVAFYDGPGSDSDFAYALAVDGSGNAYVTGYSYSGISPDYGTVKYNTSGAEEWVARYDGPANEYDVAIALAVDGSGNVYVTGTTTLTQGTQYTTIKYRQVTTEYIAEPDLPRQFVLHQNYPNPFNPSTTIKYGLPKKAHVKLDVFNMLGQQVAELAEGEQEPGYHSVTLESSRLASGLYLYRLQAGDFMETKKLIVLR